MTAPVRLVLLGHVDHGKSTLIGRLCLDTGSLFDGKYQSLVEAARHRGTPVELANLMDALQSERDQNVTIDTAQIWLRVHDRQYVIIDAPGHREFVQNMVTGAAQADAALVVIDAAEGVQEQSRRHGSLAKLLGISQIIVAVNKMDLVDYQQAAFDRFSREYADFLAALGLRPMEIVPLSAATGENVVAASARMPWCGGPSLLDALARLSPAAPAVHLPMRLPVQAVYRFDHRRVIAGRLESGTLQPGDEVVFLPSGKRSRVKTIERWNRSPEEPARAGDSIGITLFDPLFIERGEVAAAIGGAAPTVTTEIRARVFWLGRRPLEVGRAYRLKLVTQDVSCEIVSVEEAIDASTLEPRPGGRAVSRDEVADVTVRTRTPIVMDPYSDMAATGRFVIVDGVEIAGGGIVVRAEAERVKAVDQAAPLVRAIGHVDREERHARNRHGGAVVWFTGLSGSGKSTLAAGLERALFDRGMQVFVLDGDNVRFGLNGDLGFSAADRAENLRRVAEVAKLFAEAGLIVVTALISPYRSDRRRARQILREGGLDIPFLEVYLDVPIEVCIARDPKGLYAKAQAGAIRGFTGISDPYEPPEAAEIVLRTADQTIDDCRTVILDRLLPVVALTGC